MAVQLAQLALIGFHGSQTGASQRRAKQHLAAFR